MAVAYNAINLVNTSPLHTFKSPVGFGALVNINLAFCSSVTGCALACISVRKKIRLQTKSKALIVRLPLALPLWSITVMNKQTCQCHLCSGQSDKVRQGTHLCHVRTGRPSSQARSDIQNC